MVEELDFLWRLNGKINSLGLFVRSSVGMLGPSDSLSVTAMPGGNETVFMNGIRDKDYQVQINAKSQDQVNCIEALSMIARVLENLKEGDIKSENGSFDFESISVKSMPNIVAHDEQGYYTYALSISAKITIYKGAA